MYKKLLEKIAKLRTWLNLHSINTRTMRNRQPKIRRNEPCPCSSGMKYKKCCLGKQKQPTTQLAKGEFEKQRKYLLKSAHKKYKEVTNGT